jgi:hypothetical protein
MVVMDSGWHGGFAGLIVESDHGVGPPTPLLHRRGESGREGITHEDTLRLLEPGRAGTAIVLWPASISLSPAESRASSLDCGGRSSEGGGACEVSPNFFPPACLSRLKSGLLDCT